MILSGALILNYLVKVACRFACHFALVNQGVSVIPKKIKTERMILTSQFLTVLQKILRTGVYRQDANYEKG